MKLNSLELAELIISSFQPENEVDQSVLNMIPNNELISILKNKSVEDLAYWLTFHSFTKYRLEKALSEAENIDVKNPSVEHKNSVNDIMKNYLLEIATKKDLQKFTASDFNELSDKERDKLIKSISYFALEDEHHIDPVTIQMLINAKMRRNETLGRNLNITFISAKSFVAESTVRILFKKIRQMKPGERQQFFYLHHAEPHAFGLDVEIRVGKVNLFAVDSIGDPRFYEGLGLLIHLLKETFRLRAIGCNAELQKDKVNCTTYTLSILNEFAKYEHVFDYVSDFDAILKAANEIKNDVKAGKKQEDAIFAAYSSSKLPKEKAGRIADLWYIPWVDLKSLPTKIISMSQSYHHMEETLRNSKHFDLDPKEFVKRAQLRDKYDTNEEFKTKYINRRKQHIQLHFQESFPTSIDKHEYETYFADAIKEMEARNFAVINDDFIKGTVEQFKNSQPQTINTSDILQFIELFYYQVEKHIPENTDEKSKLILSLQNVYLHYASKQENIDDLIIDLAASSLLHVEINADKLQHLDSSIKTPKQTAAEIFSLGELLYLQKKIPQKHRQFLPNVIMDNPIPDMIKNVNTTSNDLITALENLEKKYVYRKDLSVFSYNEQVMLLNNIIDENEKKQTDEKEKTRIVQLIWDTYEKLNARKRNAYLAKHPPVVKTRSPESKPTDVTLISKISDFFSSGIKAIKKKTLSEILIDYYREKPADVHLNAFRDFNIKHLSEYDLKLAMFYTNQELRLESRWIKISTLHPKYPADFEWKFNLSIHGDDIEQALGIIVSIANKYHLGSMKVMGSEMVATTRNNPQLLGREFVLYCNMNPEISNSQWVDIINEIEQSLSKNNVRTSRKDAPISNRKLGKYASYTHEAWTQQGFDTSFEEGIKEAALEDEDPFAEWHYDESLQMAIRTASPAKKL